MSIFTKVRTDKMLFQNQDKLNPARFDHFRSQDTLEDFSGDTNSLPWSNQRKTKVQGTRRRELVAGLALSDRRPKWNRNWVREGKSSSCNQKQCGKIKERLHRHLYEQHPRSKPNGAGPSNSIIAHSTQTNLNSIDRLLTDYKRTRAKKVYKEQSRRVIPLRKTETRKLLAPKKNFFKQHLQDEVFKWFQDIPTFPSSSKGIKLKRLLVINNLVAKIADLSSVVNTIDYNEKVRHEIEYCLDVLPMWYPGKKVEKIVFKNNLCQSLLKTIERLNEKWLHDEKEQESVVATYDLRGTFPFEEENNDRILSNEIANWVDTNLKIRSDIERHVANQVITGAFIKRLAPILKSKAYTKHVLIEEIINILEEFSINIIFPRNRIMYLNKLAEELADKVKNLSYTNNCAKVCINQMYENKEMIFDNSDDDTQNTSLEDETHSEEIANFLTLADDSEGESINQVTNNCYDSIHSVINKDICEVFKSSGEFSEGESSTLANNTLAENGINLRDSGRENFNIRIEDQHFSGTLVVLTSEHDLSGPFDNGQPLTSTPLLPVQKKEAQKLNQEEITYMSKVAAVVKTWLETTDTQFVTTEEQFFKDSIANDIAGDVKDLAKLSQIQENMMMSYYEAILSYIIMRAILKYGLLAATVSVDTPHVVDLKNRIINLGMPDLMMPQHGNRQNTANVKFRYENPTRAEFQPDALDILEDNISVWLSEQPSDIYKDQDREQRNILLHDIAMKVQKQMENNNSEDDIRKELKQWLKKIVNPKSNKDIDGLAEDLNDKIMRLPQNETIAKKSQKRARARAGEDTDLEPEQYSHVDTAPDEQLKQFIEKFIEQNYNVEDSLVKGVFTNILLQELLKLSPTLREEVCDSKSHEGFNAEKFRRELEYIKEVSDWLKNIPFYPMLKSGNDRVEFVNGLAKNIAVIEEERITDPGKMNYELMLHSDIFEYMKQLPIPNQYLPNLNACVNQLRERIARHRPSKPSPSAPNKANSQITIQNEQDFAKFIEEFVIKHAKDIGEDQLKLEAYLARLLKEVKRIIIEKADTDTLTDVQVYKRLEDVPMPGKESVVRFGIEMAYAQQIAEWLHNFPLLPLKSEEENETRIRMISELSQKMIETDQGKAENPNNSKADTELEEYIANWISQLNLDPRKQIVVSVLISQLKNRMENVKKESEKTRRSKSETVNDVEDKPINRSKRKCRPGSFSCKIPSCCKSLQTQKPEEPGELIIEAIEKWCQDLPIHEDNEDATNAMKEKVATNILQKVGLLNNDPQVANDDLLFRDMLALEIEAELQNLSKYSEINSNKEDLHTSLLDKVMDVKKIIKDIYAGENYKLALENTIDASLPNPVHISNKHDPGYELYRNRMALLWLLENFDYSVDFTSLKYKKKLTEEIDKYSYEAQKRNILPMENHEVFNEIFSALYKRNQPAESSIIEEVENIKTRCEIDAWLKELPLKKASGFQELLERDQILSLLAKRLYNIEKKKELDADEKMRREIMKWLKKLPLLPNEDKNMVNYADKLICNLKATEDSRKCKREMESNAVNANQVSKSAQDNELNKTKDVSQLDILKDTLKGTRKANTSQISGPSRTRPKSCCEGSTVPRKKAGDLITAAVETWCRQLPLIAQNSEDKELNDHLKDEAIIKLYQILSDLHADLNILNSEGLYEHHLNIEIEKLLFEIPGCCELQQTRNARRAHLIKELLGIRPLVKDELDREGYKQELKHAISSFFDETTTPNKIVVNSKAKDDIIDNFIEYSFHRGEFDDQQFYKLKINDVLAKLLEKNKDKADPLLTRNQLICEMSKVKPPKDSALLEEIQEIRMKNEIAQLFNEIEILDEEEKASQIKQILAKKLLDIEEAGHNCSNDRKMKKEISKALKKLGIDVDLGKIYAFIKHLKENEDDRKASPRKKYNSCACFKNQNSNAPPGNRNIPLGPSLVLRSPRQSFYSASPSPNRSLPNSFTQAPKSPDVPQLSITVPQPLGSISQSPKNTPFPMSVLQPPSFPQDPSVQARPQNGPSLNIPNINYQSPINSYNQLPQSSNPDFDLGGPQTAYRQPQPTSSLQPLNPPMVDDPQNLHSNLQMDGTEQTGTRTTARIQGSPQIELTSNWPNNPQQHVSTDVEADIFDDCNCRRNKKRKNCKGVCKVDDKPEYCDECENDHDCDYDILYPYPIPGFILL